MLTKNNKNDNNENNRNLYYVCDVSKCGKTVQQTMEQVCYELE